MARPRSFNDILARLPGARQSGDNWIAPCPLPGHQTPQEHLNLKDAGDKALVTCQGGRHSYEDICQALGFDSLTYSTNGNGPEVRIIATIYDYTDANGELLYQVLRYEPKEFKQRRPDGAGGWFWNLKGVEPVLYRLPEVSRAVREGQTVYVCEGEKDADNLAKLGLIATTNSGGAEKWRPGYAEALAGASVVILPDKDAPGQRHAVKVATSLHGKVRSVKVVELPDREGHEVKDVTDWLAEGGTVVELERLVNEAPEWKPNESDSLICLAQVEPEAVDWLWYPYIPLGKLTLLEGDPGIGKSWVSLAMATGVSLGRGLPGAETTEPGRVLLASAEDGLGDTIRPRLDAMGADNNQIHAIRGGLDFGNSGLVILEGFIEGVKPSLVIIDPLVAYIGAGVDIHRANETRAVMAKLADIAEKHGCAILAVRHLTKGGTVKPIYRGLGSIDLAAACRSVLMAGCDPDNPQNRGLVHIKSNLAPMGAAVGYELRDQSFYWTGESALTWQKILAAEDSGEGKSAIDEATEFLKDELADGAVDASQVWRDARDTGLSEKTIKRAKAKLRIITRRQGETGKRGGGKFTWELPEDSLGVQKDLEGQEGHIKNFDSLNNSSFENGPLPEGDDPLNPETVLGMPVEKALAIWRSEGAPVIHLGAGENCLDLEKLLSYPLNERQAEAVKAWLNKKIAAHQGEAIGGV